MLKNLILGLALCAGITLQAQDNGTNALPQLSAQTTTNVVVSTHFPPVNLTAAQMDGIIQAVIMTGVNDVGVRSTNLQQIVVRRLPDPTGTNAQFQVTIRTR